MKKIVLFGFLSLYAIVGKGQTTFDVLRLNNGQASHKGVLQFGLSDVILENNPDGDYGDLQIKNWSAGGYTNTIRFKANGNIGIGTIDPWYKLQLVGTFGLGKFNGSPHAGLLVDYVDELSGSGTTTFKHQRWGGGFYFKRNGANGERTQVFFGGAASTYMDIYDNNNSINIRLHAGGDSFFNAGKVGIGTMQPDQLLTVNGTIHAKEVKVDLSVPAPDYVFEKEYNLLPLAELEAYIKANKHLPEVPSAKEMEADGMNLKEMNLILLKKVEELTLHLIKLNETVQNDKATIKKLEQSIEELKHNKK